MLKDSDCKHSVLKCTVPRGVLEICTGNIVISIGPVFFFPNKLNRIPCVKMAQKPTFRYLNNSPVSYMGK